MASSKLRTHPGQFSSNHDDSRSTITGLFHRAPAADPFQRLAHSLLSVPLDGGRFTFVADNCLKLNAQPPPLSRTAAPEFMLSNNETENEPPDAREVIHDGVKPDIRGPDDL